MPSTSSQEIRIIETLVHVSASASATDDLKNISRARKILDWETGSRFPIYPLPTIPRIGSFIEDQERSAAAECQNETSQIEIPDSPSHIPDSQPTTPHTYNSTDITQLTPQNSLPHPRQPTIAIRSPSSSDRPLQTTYQPEARPPQPVSLEPIPFSAPQSHVPIQRSDSPDHRPEQYAVFTSTPKSKPLRKLLGKNDTLSISYPMPKVNSDDIPLVPSPLASLFPLSLFRCKSQSRELGDWERGFWKVDLSVWREEEKLDFWKRMRKAIESGRFGWIYVLFDAYEEDVVNVFCFGGAAKHVWVFLYVMSTKRTKHGLQYFDSSEKVVIEGTSLSYV